MENKNNSNGKFSRRRFLGSTAAFAAFSAVPLNFYDKISTVAAGAGDTTPDSNFGGVQIGAITYSWRSMPGGVENVIKYCIEDGISSIELMSNDLEDYLGAPKNPRAAMSGSPQRRELTPEQQAAVAKYPQDLKAWRTSLPMSKLEEVRKMFDKAGIKIPIVKFSPAKWSDEEIDYAFKAAKAMGARGVSEEIGEEAVKKLGPIAAKHGMYAVFHNHMQFGTPGFSYDPFLAVSPAVMLNFDAGHFFGSTGIHPNTIIEKYHDRIISIHLKDKTGPKTDPPNTNQVWGQGEAPIADVLLLIKKQKWPIYCHIELEYDIKPWSNAVKETKTCVQYARQILI
jgi:sugar phosphate isomerase/epimerase